MTNFTAVGVNVFQISSVTSGVVCEGRHVPRAPVLRTEDRADSLEGLCGWGKK